MNVLDASIVAELLLGGHDERSSLRLRVAELGSVVAAPSLLDIEVTQVVRRAVRAGACSERDARDSIDALARFPAVRLDHRPLLQRAFDMRDNLTVYDAVYVAMAEALGGTLLTMDASLARAPGVPECVELFTSEVAPPGA